MSATRRSPAAISLALLLAAILLLSAVLAFEAVSAVRQREALASRTVQDYVAFAATEIAARAGALMDQSVRQVLDPVTAISASSPYERFSAVEPVARVADQILPCHGTPTPLDHLAFQYDLRDGSLILERDATPTLRRWLADTLPELVRGSYRPEQHYAVVGGVPGAPGQVLLLAVKWAQVGAQARPVAPIGVIGFLRCRSAFGVPLVQAALRGTALPGSGRGAATAESLLVVSLRDEAGSVIWSNGGAGAVELRAEAPVPTPANLRLEAVLRTGAVAQLTVGTPGTVGRLPWLVALLAVSAALAAMALRQLHRERELVRLRADFTSSVSHELRTPLAQILLAGETLALDRTRSAEERTAAAGLIVDEARHLIGMVENVLTFAGLERGTVRSDPRPVALGPAIRTVLTQWAATLGMRARLVPALDDALWARVDPGALRQILSNLLDNAVKFGPTGQVIRVGLGGDAAEVTMTVEDQGPGVSVEERERIWLPFARGAAGGAAHNAGAGLGLAVVRDLVRQQGGSVEVGVAAGGGARFVVRLPRCPAEHPGSEAVTTLPTRLERQR